MDHFFNIADGMSASEIIGFRLRMERKRLRLTTQQLSEMVGFSRMSVSNYEQGKRSPDALYLLAAYKIGVDVGYVITGKRTRGEV